MAYTGLADLLTDVQALTPDLLDTGLIITDPSTGMPASGPLPVGTSPGPSISNWLQQNKPAVYAGAGILVFMAMFGGKRR